ncbi:hypothetical protein HPY15_15150 [Vibrio cholerae]|uniref:hypothetical protein n=1 Tax=Vibrio cholerae TaxID=666 RepID=UPI000BA8EBD0|nr:hypothetical protein [Vibrio cholerae]PAS03648.1 hypothetical protein CGT78_18825 [Vibrio cholerae]PAS18639.1 hypothetical protein CGT74_17870 [Vibrio cholerae]QKU94549.1 hypothetical protein HPY15_15150 [Vibrio cholerae]HDL9450477.1 hypothetical protein [Vibrio cholerae]
MKIEEFRKKLNEFSIEGVDSEECIYMLKSLPIGVLDKDFTKKIVSPDTLKARLSELFVSMMFHRKKVENLTGKDDGPDVIFDFDSKKYNVEVVTPLEVEKQKGKFRVFSPNDSPSCEDGEIVDANSFKLRVSSVFKSKVKQFEKWINKGIVESGDVNIICINIGFIDSLMLGDMDSLWRVFYNEQVVLISGQDEENIYCELYENPTSVNKKDKQLKQSYFNTEEIDCGNIDGVLLVNIKKPTSAEERSIFFESPSAKLNVGNIFKNDILNFIVHRHPDHYLLDQIRQNGKVRK